MQPPKQYKHNDEKMKNKPSEIDNIADKDAMRREPETYSLMGDDVERDPLEKPTDDKQDMHLHPTLHWYGKKEEVVVDTSPLFENEVIDPKYIIGNMIEAISNEKREEDDNIQDLMKDQNILAEEAQKQRYEYYQHEKNWKNRIIIGDSLKVMNSLIGYENMAGKVKVVYFDPPYGINYSSNFQLATDDKNVKDTEAGVTEEIEMLKAFRDTWKHGIHSYLDYLHTRIKLTKDLLSDDGSIFVQIGMENMNLVKILLDEIFGEENLMSIITLKKSSSTTSNSISNIADYIIWYAKDKKKINKRILYTKTEKIEIGEERYDSLISRNAYRPTLDYDYTMENGEEINLPKGRRYIGTKEGTRKLEIAGRLIAKNKKLHYVRYSEDFPAKEITNVWETMLPTNKTYVVETSTKAVERCLIMASDPGDLVLDITCGSGTTAYVAEEIGRRWITCDTSRIATHLAKIRMASAKFPYYILNEENNIKKNFKYDTVPHIKMEDIVKNENIKEGMTKDEISKIIKRDSNTETLYLHPQENKKITRVAGPFQIETLASEIYEKQSRTTDIKREEGDNIFGEISDEKMTGYLLEELKNNHINIGDIKGHKIDIQNVKIIPPGQYTQAETEYRISNGDTGDLKTARVLVGRADQVMSATDIKKAFKTAGRARNIDGIIYLAFGYTADAQQEVELLKNSNPQMDFFMALINSDLQTSDLKNTKDNKDAFRLIGRPDIKVSYSKTQEKYIVEILGYDFLRMDLPGAIRGGKTDKIAMWAIDTNYDGRIFMPSQTYFPGQENKPIWKHLIKDLRLNKEALSDSMKLKTHPFKQGDQKAIAVKIIDNTAVESMAVVDFEIHEDEIEIVD